MRFADKLRRTNKNGTSNSGALTQAALASSKVLMNNILTKEDIANCFKTIKQNG